MVENIDRILELYKSNNSKREVARLMCKELNIEFNDNVRRNISRLISSRVDKGILDECDKVGIDPKK